VRWRYDKSSVQIPQQDAKVPYILSSVIKRKNLITGEGANPLPCPPYKEAGEGVRIECRRDTDSRRWPQASSFCYNLPWPRPKQHPFIPSTATCTVTRSLAFHSKRVGYRRPTCSTPISINGNEYVNPLRKGSSCSHSPRWLRNPPNFMTPKGAFPCLQEHAIDPILS
jgi:hypothetical protein